MKSKNFFFAIGTLGVMFGVVWGGSHLKFPSLASLKDSKVTLNPEEEPPLSIPPSQSIGVVDISRIKSDSKIFKKFTELFAAQQSIIHGEVLEKEKDLMAEFESLKKQEESTGLSQDIVKRKTDLDIRVAELEKMVRGRKEELDKEVNEILGRIKAALKAIMNDLGKENGLSLIINKSLGDGEQMDHSVVLFSKVGLDLTDSIIKRLDKKLSVKDISPGTIGLN